MISCFWEAQYFPWAPSAVIFAPSKYLHGSQPQSSPCGQTPHPPSLMSLSFSTQPPLSVMGVSSSHFSAGKCCPATIPMVKSLCFAFWATVAAFPSEVLKLPPAPYPRLLSVQKLFLLHNTLHGVQVPVPKFFVSFSNLYLLPYLIIRRSACLFGKLGFSASIQKVFFRSCPTCKLIFDGFVGR